MTDAQWAGDPTGRHQYRWFDGSTWTDRVSDAGEQSFDPLQPGPMAGPYAMSRRAGGSVNVPEGTVIASRGRRFLGLLLGLVLMIVTLVIGYVIWAMIVWSRGQTPAKQLMGMRVMKADTGRPATWGEMFLRGFAIDTLIPMVPLLGWMFSLVSAFWIFGNDEHRRLTDIMAGTIVVDDPDNRYG